MSPPSAARFVARVEGRVQGVGFRMFVRERALDLGLSGSVRNMPDRSVRVEAEGSKEVLEALIADLHQGPPAARVERVAVDWVPPRGTAHFRVEAG